MAVCRFYQQGYCKFGSTFTLLRKLSPRDAPLHQILIIPVSQTAVATSTPMPEAIATSPRTASEPWEEPPQAPMTARYVRDARIRTALDGADLCKTAKYSITPEVIEKDLTSDAPQWILSAYAPGRDAPDQLFGGYPREQSFEELRLHYLMGKASGNEQQAVGISLLSAFPHDWF